MLSRLTRQTSLLVCRQQKVLSYIQQKTIISSESTRDDSVLHEWENEVNVHEITVNKPIREWVATELSDVAPKPTPFYSSERDLVNFPKRVYNEKAAPTRLVLFPESWFKYMYPKMGVSGPYVLGFGIWILFAQKEWLLIEGHEWEHLCAWYMWFYVFTRTQLGSIFSDILSNGTKALYQGAREFEEIAVEHRKEAIAFEKEAQQMCDTKMRLFDVKKQNVAMQQEATYRENAMDLYNQVKRRLDYQVAINQIDSRIKQQFMVNWVIGQVQQALAKTSEKDALKQCINDLNTLAARA